MPATTSFRRRDSLTPVRLLGLLALLAGLFASLLTASVAAAGVESDESGSSEWEANALGIAVYGCPAGTDPGAALGDLYAACTFDAGPTTFTLTNGLAGAETLTTSGGSPNITPATGLAFEADESAPNAGDGYPGQLTISLPSGALSSIVHCTYSSAGGGAVWGPSLVEVYGGTTIDVVADAGHTLGCDWFLIPPDAEVIEEDVIDVPDSLEATEIPAVSTATVRISKYTCPAGYIALDDDYLMSEQCREPAAPVDFWVTNEEGFAVLVTASGEVPLGATVTDVPASTIGIFEEVPDGFSDPLAFCSDTPADGAGNYEPVPLDASGAVRWELQAGSTLGCVFFNFQHAEEPGGDVPAEGVTGSVRVSKYTCPAGTERIEDDYALSDQCVEEAAPVAFTIWDEPTITFSTTEVTSGGIPQSVEFAEIPFGGIVISETVPDGFGEPLAFCSDTPADGAGNYEPVPVVEGSRIHVEHRAEAEIPLTCLFFNFYDDEPTGEGGDIHLSKYTCPAGYEPADDDYIMSEQCREDVAPVTFTVSGPGGFSQTLTATAGVPQGVDFAGVPFGTITISEDAPTGYGTPQFHCTDTPADGAGNYELVPTIDGSAIEIEHRADAPIDLAYVVFNFHEGDPDYSALEVIKHTCPAGYDLEAADADPYVDCPELTDGVDFSLSGPGVDMDSTTGNAGDGAIFFGGLPPGDYTVTESIPDGIDSAFVTDCQGLLTDAVQPYPLATGDTLTIPLVGGELVTCHWFNVPEQEGGQLTVIKYTCSTPEYESDIDCEIFEGGQGFDLLDWNGSAYVFLDSGTTDGAGRLTWTGLDEGSYLLDEHDREWCHVEPSIVPEEDLNGFMVLAGQEQVVKVYNCDGEPGRPGKTPTEYPDTGVAPTTGGESTLPAIAAAGLLGLTLNRRRLAALTLTGTAVAIGGNRVLAAQDQTIEPAGATPSDLPDSLCLPAEPGDEPGTCRRGPVPVTLQIDAIGVAAPIEVLETVQGVMQQPSDEVHVAWYKETARLGEIGNLHLAGHINWWGVPEAVFFHLGELREGDEVLLSDEDETAHTYTVEWVRQESNLEPPAEEVLGMTAYEAVTLMTCSGEWNSEISEYDSRTVVRARRVPEAGTPEA